MDKEKSDFLVGYGKTPHHTRFKPGQSGNPGGRPMKKANTLAETFEKELIAKVSVKEGDTWRKITRLEAIVKQLMNKAILGDHKAAALVMKIVESQGSNQTDNLHSVVQAMWAVHAKHEIANQNGSGTTGASELTDNAANDSVDQDHA